MTKTYEQARDEAAARHAKKWVIGQQSVNKDGFRAGADFGRDWERKRSEKLFNEFKQVYVYSNDLLITKIAERAIAEYEAGSEIELQSIKAVREL
jgi:hypothetical protein